MRIETRGEHSIASFLSLRPLYTPRLDGRGLAGKLERCGHAHHSPLEWRGIKGETIDPLSSPLARFSQVVPSAFLTDHAAQAIRQGSQEGRQDPESRPHRRQEAQTQEKGVLLRLHLPCPQAGSSLSTFP